MRPSTLPFPGEYLKSSGPAPVIGPTASQFSSGGRGGDFADLQENIVDQNAMKVVEEDCSTIEE
jgi:hypothetical protein